MNRNHGLPRWQRDALPLSYAYLFKKVLLIATYIIQAIRKFIKFLS